MQRTRPLFRRHSTHTKPQFMLRPHISLSMAWHPQNASQSDKCEHKHKPLLTRMAKNGKLREDDVLECFLYSKFCFTTNPDQVTEALLMEEIVKFKEVIDKYTSEYMWNRDALSFRPRTKQALLLEKVLEGSAINDDRSMVPHIHSTLRFDEDIGDEWFTVFLIFKLTEKFEGLVARLVDGDGEFLLIEAAEFLPTWANPETCQDRVFICNGKIHVLHDRVTRGRTLLDVLKSVRDKPHLSVMSDKVQAVLQKRLSFYPEEIQKRKHKARAFLPEKAASILAQEPGLIASAIRSIVHSDPLERKVCRAMRYFPPEQRTMVNVKMTRCLYAMSTHCRYTGDPRTGWNFPPTNSPKYNAHLLGIKIACGLELLVARANEERRSKGETNEEKKSPVNEQAWSTFQRRLELSGYFRGMLEGSQERERLLLQAKEYFESQVNVSKYATSNEESEAERILKAWENVQTNDFEMHAQDEASLSPPDSDGWLNVDPAQLEAMLGQHWNIGDKKCESNQPPSLREKVQEFLNQSSDVDGIQFPGEQSRDDDTKHDQDDGGRIDFDSDVFDSTLRDILDLVVPGGDGEFDGSSEGSLGGDDDDRGGEMDKYMRLLGTELQAKITKDQTLPQNNHVDAVETNLMQSVEEEAGGAGPISSIIGGPVRRLMHLPLQSPTTCVLPDLQS